MTFTKTFIMILALIESGGDPDALGDKCPETGVYMAQGCLQMWEISVKEANNILGYPAFNAKDRLDPQACYEMARIIGNHWQPILEKRYKVKWTPYDALAFWRHGPTNWDPQDKTRLKIDRDRNRQYDYYLKQMKEG